MCLLSIRPLKNYLAVLVTMLLTALTNAEKNEFGEDRDEWRQAMDDYSAKSRALSEKKMAIVRERRILEEKYKVQEEHLALLNSRLEKLNERLGDRSPGAVVTGSGEDAGTGAPPVDVDVGDQERERELMVSAAERIVLLVGKGGAVGTGFLSAQGETTRVFTSARLVGEAGDISIKQLDGSPLPVGTELSCPDELDLVCLHPQDPDLPRFDLATSNEFPDIGERVVVISVDPETSELEGTSGTIRGIGPDTLELDADLAPGMRGAPVLALDSGKVIGVVAPRVAGIGADWAIGTRHEEHRDFSLRLDRVGSWQTVSIDRFANQAAYIERINEKTRMLWTAHMMIELENWMPPEIPWPEQTSNQSEDDRERYNRARERVRRKRTEQAREAKAIRVHVYEMSQRYATNPHIERVQNWLTDYRNKWSGKSVDDLEARRANIYRLMRTDMAKTERDLSAHLTGFHAASYREAITSRKQGLRVIAAKGERVGH